ncbi:MAG: biotin--[Bacteroidales bacterium]|nr:biotin--[acetyl-CoA-carboxylase] ligase [Bacteroidales bacterium]
MKNRADIKWFDTLDSTNSEALRHIRDYDNLSVLAAWNQTAGRGQRGNAWKVASGENLTFSVVLKPESFPVSAVYSVNEVAAITVRDWANALLPRAHAVVKWPNDIYCGNKKLCGILVENGLEGGSLAWSVAGIGINVNQTAFPPDLMNPTSLRLEGADAERLQDLPELLRIFCDLFADRWEYVQASPEHRAEFHAGYCRNLYRLDERHEWSLPDGSVFQGTLKGVTEDGRACIQDASGNVRLFGFKEVGYII